MRRVLITGATTPLGRATVRALAADAAVDRVLAVGLENELSEPGLEKVIYRRCDLTRPRDLRTLITGTARELSIDSIIHGALHRSTHDRGERIHALNVEATRELMDLAEASPTIERFVFESSAAIYRVDAGGAWVIGEGHPLEHEAGAPQWLRDRIEADLTVCARMGLSRLSIAVLRFAECPAPESASQLYDYLSRKVCLRPLGFDPMLNLISIADRVRALQLALHSGEQGVFNVPGRDTLPLSRTIALSGRTELPAPGFLLGSLHWLRRFSEFRYELNRRRFHFGAVLDGARARERLGYQPAVVIDWGALTAGS